MALPVLASCDLSRINLVFVGLVLSAVVATADGGQLRLSGTVVNGVTGVPVRYAQLSLIPDGSFVQTDAAGGFTFSGLEPGTYTLWVCKQGFVPFGDEEEGASITLTESREKFNVRLTPLSAIRGRILDDSGDPVERATLVAMQSVLDQGQRRKRIIALVQTNDRGEYRIANLRSGEYLIQVSPETSRTGFYGQGPARASAIETFAPVFFGGASDLAHATPLTVSPGGEGHADFRVNLRPGRVVRGRIDGFRPHTSATVQLSASDGGLGLTMQSIEYAAGRFEIFGVLDGSYVLRIYQNGEGDRVLFGEQNLNVAGQDLDGVTVTLQPASSLSGAVRLEGETAPVPQVQVVLQAENDLPALVDPLGFRQSGEIENGRFQIPNVIPGRYSIHFEPFTGQYIASARSGQVDLLATGELTVTAGATPEIEIVLRTDGGSVTGTASSKTPPPPMSLVLLAPESCNRPAEVTLMEEGAFEFQDVPPGRYRLHAWKHPAAVEYSDHSAVCALARGGTPVEVVPGRTVTVQLAALSEESK